MHAPTLRALQFSTAALLAAVVFSPQTAHAEAQPDSTESWPYVAPPPPPPTAEEEAAAERAAAEREAEREANPREPAPPPTPVDIELALLVDASGSVDSREWALQIDGYVKAFENPAVQAQIQRSDGVAVMFMTWSSTTQQRRTGWYELRTVQDCLDFARKISGFPRTFSDNTIMSNAIGVGMYRLRRNNFVGKRNVIDVSGDGVCENQAYYTHHERGEDPAFDELLGPTWDYVMSTRPSNTTINGISIGDVEGLSEWYADVLPQGSGSFAMHVDDFEQFAVAIRDKLVRELEPTSYD